MAEVRCLQGILALRRPHVAVAAGVEDLQIGIALAEHRRLHPVAVLQRHNGLRGRRYAEAVAAQQFAVQIDADVIAALHQVTDGALRHDQGLVRSVTLALQGQVKGGLHHGIALVDAGSVLAGLRQPHAADLPVIVAVNPGRPALHRGCNGKAADALPIVQHAVLAGGQRLIQGQRQVAGIFQLTQLDLLDLPGFLRGADDQVLQKVQFLPGDVLKAIAIAKRHPAFHRLVADLGVIPADVIVTGGRGRKRSVGPGVTELVFLAARQDPRLSVDQHHQLIVPTVDELHLVRRERILEALVIIVVGRPCPQRLALQQDLSRFIPELEHCGSISGGVDDVHRHRKDPQVGPEGLHPVPVFGKRHRIHRTDAVHHVDIVHIRTVQANIVALLRRQRPGDLQGAAEQQSVPIRRGNDLIAPGHLLLRRAHQGQHVVLALPKVEVVEVHLKFHLAIGGLHLQIVGRQVCRAAFMEVCVGVVIALAVLPLLILIAVPRDHHGEGHIELAFKDSDGPPGARIAQQQRQRYAAFPSFLSRPFLAAHNGTL